MVLTSQAHPPNYSISNHALSCFEDTATTQTVCTHDGVGRRRVIHRLACTTYIAPQHQNALVQSPAQLFRLDDRPTSQTAQCLQCFRRQISHLHEWKQSMPSLQKVDAASYTFCLTRDSARHQSLSFVQLEIAADAPLRRTAIYCMLPEAEQLPCVREVGSARALVPGMIARSRT